MPGSGDLGGLIGVAYRLGVFLRGGSEGVSADVREAFCEADRRVGLRRGAERFRLEVLTEVRRRALAAQRVISGLDDYALVVSRRWPEPDRSALALRELADLSDAGLREVLGLRRVDLGEMLRRLAGRMAVELPQGTAGEGVGPPVSPWRRAILGVPVPESLEGEVEEAMREGRTRRLDVRLGLRHPAMVVVALSLLVVFALAGMALVERMTSFPGSGVVERIVRRADGVDSRKMRQSGGVAGDLEDWVFLKHGLEGFRVPASLRGWELGGYHVYEENGHPVVEAALRGGDGGLYLFRADDFRVRCGDGGWRFVRVDSWTGAVLERDGICIVVAIRGPEREVRRRLGTTAATG